MKDVGGAADPSVPGMQGGSTWGRKPRVVQVIPSLQVGGLQKVVVRLVDHLQGCSEQFVLTPAGDGPLRKEFPGGVGVAALGGRVLSGKWNVLGMAAVFRKFRPDVVHTRNWTCLDAIPAARLVGVPVVIHGEHGREAADPEGSNRFRQRVRRWLSPMVTEFVTVSRDLSRWLVRDVGIPAGKVGQIYNGVDTTRFTTTGHAEARDALRVARDEVLIGTVGRLDPVKNHGGLLTAFSRLGHFGRCRLVIVGDGPCRGELEALGRSLGLGDRLQLLGERRDVHRILPALDVFTMPSVGEGISNAILEAMATGRPVVATRVGGNPELVEDGVTGLLVESGSVEALTAAFVRYLREPALGPKHGDAGRVRVVNHFSLQRMLAAYDLLYTRLLAAVAAH